MQYKVLIFDFFGVLCTEISPFWIEEYLPGKETELRQQYLTPADRGDISESKKLEELAKLAHVTPQEIEKDWLARAHFNTALIEFIRELKSEYKIGLLSNAAAPFFHRLLALSNAQDLFDYVVVSSEVGYVKPEPEIYNIILSQMNVLPADALMIDDNEGNLIGARDVGMEGHLYTSVEDLRSYLNSF